MPTTIDDQGGLTTGQMLGRYELLMPIAKGGMGNVWAARLKGTRGFRKLVAVKTVLHTMENAQLEQMLYQEAVLASQIRHPNVAETLELGEHEGRLYLVMELVLGESLLFLLREAQAQGGVPFNVSVNLVAQVCRGLAAAHDLRDASGQRVGLIHRDVSPGNVLVTENGIVKIVDFGVATTVADATQGSGEIKGKISYLSPEQLRGEPLDARVDVFATGILLYSLTVGKHPFRCGSEASTIARILSGEPAARPSTLVDGYPEAVEHVVMRAMDMHRDQRYPTMLALLEALESAYPAAFGPRADEAVAQYVQALMKERSKDRAATLRLAEEMAETSSRHPRASVPAVTTSTAPRAATPRAAWLGVAGLLTGLSMAGGAVWAYSATAGRTAQAGGAAPPLAALAAPSPVLGPEPPRPPVAPARAAAAESAAVPAEALTTAAVRAPGVARRKKDGAEVPLQVEESAPSLPFDSPSEDALAPSAPSQEPSSLAPAAALSPSVAPSPAPSVAPLPLAPRSISSRRAHRQLLTNPSAEAARIHVPELLRRSEQRFFATVNLCVDTSGRVSQVSVLRSAGPALDPQITQALSKWRYSPLMEGASAVPFCYVLNYEVNAR